ncbi:sensor histidine kinase [Robertkochia solimangrovi]|uniref:sensor histidine kinase n=1 Tax=Robertkochia solimangrovi TaxID=2213046 RepID=UPI001180D378|nr:sensor histidine kinase [Robertkochia solimangrovi]TRZ44441.1 sensor histidine kinase [Robertkochia solimangrovi]
MNLFGNSLKYQVGGIYRIHFWHHFLMWLIYFIFNTLRWGNYYQDYVYSLKSNLVGFPIHIILSYYTIYFLMPRFVYKRKFITFSVLLIAGIFTMVYIKYLLTYALINHNVWPEGPGVTSTLTPNYLVTMMLGEIYVVSFVTAIKITIDWARENKRASLLEKTQMETELRFLRTQVSPHFFFNTLNNIYSLSIEKSDKAPETILKLSELMRYLLYETKDRYQSLIQEIMCIQNYLDLQRIRYGEMVTINMNITGDIEDRTVPPMLLITFIENCFKHGADKSLGRIFIDIDFIIDGDYLHFRVSNTMPQETNSKHRVNNSGGIGIENARKRLALGYKPEEYELKNYIDNNRYIVELKLKIT